MSECKHNWEQDRYLKIYVTCSICGERWNVERLVNCLQSKVEDDADLRRLAMKSHVCCYKYGEPACLACESCKEHGRQKFCAKRADLEGVKL